MFSFACSVVAANRSFEVDSQINEYSGKQKYTPCDIERVAPYRVGFRRSRNFEGFFVEVLRLVAIDGDATGTSVQSLQRRIHQLYGIAKTHTSGVSCAQGHLKRGFIILFSVF